MLGQIATLGADLVDLIDDQAGWSQKTFGTDQERGPIGALKHLAKEAVEAEQAWGEYVASGGAGRVGISAIPAAGKVKEELADCLLLILDASRRAGLKPLDLIHEAQSKMKINKGRTWPKPETDVPVEHVK
jgi:NTP pyrophosphatase (non-canonical NTP hydrolase)